MSTNPISFEVKQLREEYKFYVIMLEYQVVKSYTYVGLEINLDLLENTITFQNSQLIWVNCITWNYQINNN